MKVLFTCADKPTISRNRFHRKVLSDTFSYSECISKGKGYASRIPSILLRLPFAMIGKDAYFVGYMGHFLVIIMRLFTKKPIVFDFYLSIFDVMCNDRKLYKPNSLLGKLTYWMEKKSLEKADYIIVDTQKLIDTLCAEYSIDKDKFVSVPLTINEENVFPKEVKRYKEVFTVLYVGSYIPLHGTSVIMEASKILQDLGEDIAILMIGKGPDYQNCQDLVTQYQLKNIKFKGYMSLAELNYYYNATDINLGLFNSGERANAVVLNKTNDSFRVGKAHLTLATDAMQESFSDNEDIFYVQDIDPQTLANRIIEIKNNPSLLVSVGKNALKSYDKKLSNAKATQILEDAIFSTLQSQIK
ncbi:MAG: glycosyltransferase [Sulfurovum sp.]|nr:glycosyltransferase [Sulfurovum sp.]